MLSKEIQDALSVLFHCSLKDTEYTTQKQQYKMVLDYIEQLEKENRALKKRTK